MQIRKTISITKVLFQLLLLAVLTSQSVRAEVEGEGWDAHSRQLGANLEDGTPNPESSLDRLFSGGGGDLLAPIQGIRVRKIDDRAARDYLAPHA
jgi:hypothetical protein